MTSIFEKKSPAIMSNLMADFAISAIDAAAILGNLGHESGGFQFLQEKRPLVKGSKGGYGWAQWTGPRRKAFETYCDGHNVAPASDAANYGFLAFELRTSEKAAIPALKAAADLKAKVRAFEAAFERAGVKHYASREKWAGIALAAYRAATAPPTLDEEIADKLRYKAKVEDVQRSLTDLGYPTGAIDGRVEGLTVSALAAYRHDRGLPVNAAIDDALIDDLSAADREGWSRPISEERATKPHAEIAKTSATMKATWWGKVAAALGLPTAGIVGQAGKEALDPDQVDAHLSVAQRVIQFAGENWILLVCVVAAAAVAYGVFKFVDHRRVEAYRTGARA